MALSKKLEMWGDDDDDLILMFLLVIELFLEDFWVMSFIGHDEMSYGCGELETSADLGKYDT